MCSADGELLRKRKGKTLRCRFRIPLYRWKVRFRRAFARLFFCDRTDFTHPWEVMELSPLKMLKNSILELKNPRSLALIAMLLALRVVLGMFANTTLPVFGNAVKISGAFLPIAMAGAMFGPVPALLVGALGDIVSFLIVPTGAYFPGFTVSGALTGLIYGFFLYQNRFTLPRVILAWSVNTLVVETFLAAYWLFLLYSASAGKSYEAWLLSRVISQAVKCVPEILIVFGAGRLICKAERSLSRKT